MLSLDRILCPTDGSECANTARRHAVSFADQFDATLDLLHVEEREVELTDTIEIRETDVLADLHAPLEGAPAVGAPERVRERRVAHPSAAEGILAYAEEEEIDLVVIGTHGRRGVQRLVLGSVAEEVVRRAPCPVVAVRQGAKTPEALEGGRIVVPVDFSEYQVRLLAHARALAQAYDMTLTLLHVIEVTGLPDVYKVYSDPPEPGALENQTRRVLEKRAEEMREEDLKVEVEVRIGHAADEILNTAEALDVDLLAIATHGRTGLDRVLMGSVAEKVIRRAPCSVFVVKAFGTSLVREEDEMQGGTVEEPDWEADG